MTKRLQGTSKAKSIIATILVVSAVGAIASNLATPEKKVDRRIEHRHGVSDPQFQREMAVLPGPSIVSGNSVVALQNGAQIFPAMLSSIRGARRTITFETYIYWSGKIGEEFSDALSERARAGVAVNVTIDWLGSVKMEEKLLQSMQQAGVRLHRYRSLKWYNMGQINNRTHRKLLAVDGNVGFTGGVGIADQWGGAAKTPITMTDVFEHDLEQAQAYTYATWMNRPWRERLGEWLTRPFASQL